MEYISGSTPIKSLYKGSNLVYQVEETSGDSSIFDGYNLDIIVDLDETEQYHILSFRTSDNNELKNFDITSNQQNITYTFTEEEISQLRYVNIVGCYIRQINKLPNIAWSSTYKLFKDLTTPTVNFSNLRYTNIPYNSWSNLLNFSEFSSSIKVFKLNDVKLETTTPMSGNLASSFMKLENVEELYLRNFPTSGVKEFSLVFSYATNLKILDVTGWDISSVTNYTSMFYNTTSLNKLILGNVSQSTYDWWYARLTDVGIQNNVTIEANIV